MLTQCHGGLLHLCRLGGKGDEGSGNTWEHLPTVVCLKPWGVEHSTGPGLLVFLGKGVLEQECCWDDLTTETNYGRELAFPRE